MAIHIYTSNQMEVLCTELGRLLADDSRDVFRPETVVIQNRSMARWISLQIADAECAICANVDFLLPQNFIRQILLEAGILPENDLFVRDILVWRIFILLRELETQYPFLGKYVDKKQLKRYQLAGRLADLFDRYLTYRPEMLSAWLSDPSASVPDGQEWQINLWQRLHNDAGEAFNQALLRYVHGAYAESGVPERLFLFGFTSLPPLYLDFFQALSRRISVYLFYFSPCKEYWGDIVKTRDKIRLELSGNEECWDEGNPLLGSWGRLGRDFLNLFLGLDNIVKENIRYIDAKGVGEQTLLEKVQNEILHLETPSSPSLDRPDDSLTIQACHNPLREVEILYDHLLDRIERFGLEPQEILVMAPDIHAYAPYIQTVFGNPEENELAIPFRMADRSLHSDILMAGCFCNILDLAATRVTATAVLDIIENDAVARKFGLTPEDLELVRSWVVETNTRWGLDAGFREEEDLPAFDDYSWKMMHNRLLMGYAISDDRQLVENILPFAIEQNEALAVGRFLDFSTALFDLVKNIRSRTARRATEWQDLLDGILETFFERSIHSANEYNRLSLAVRTHRLAMDKFAADPELEYTVLRNIIKNACADDSGSGGYLLQGVTFCRLRPMRSIPAKMICLLGMNEGDFPRRDLPQNYDLISRSPKPGDRSLRDDDRYLFLETLLSARQALYISYIARTVADNESVQPSILVDELLDYLDHYHGIERENIVAEHFLHSFNPGYFTGGSGGYFSYSGQGRAGAEALLAPEKRFFRFVAASLPSEPLASVTIPQLVAFFRNPSAYFLKKRLGIYLETGEQEGPEDVEPFALGRGLPQYAVGREIVEAALADHSVSRDVIFRLVQGKGRLPVLPIGATEFDTVYEEARIIAAAVATHAQGMRQDVLKADFVVNNIRFFGTLRDLYPGGQVLWQFSKKKPKYLLDGLIRHLVAGVAGLKSNTTVVFKDETVSFPTIEAETAMGFLAELLALFGRGHSQPLCFFPTASFEYWNSLRCSKDDDPRQNAIQKAAKKWYSGQYSYGEDQDAAYTLCFGREFPGIGPDASFTAIAEQVFGIYDRAVNPREEGNG